MAKKGGTAEVSLLPLRRREAFMLGANPIWVAKGKEEDDYVVVMAKPLEGAVFRNDFDEIDKN
ncbi:MAG: hypothetical protein PHN78_04555 [Dehalococcoidales bacterium]|nr:hypothetical protein [Dehalococcoidales bacterium]